MTSFVQNLAAALQRTRKSLVRMRDSVNVCLMIRGRLRRSSDDGGAMICGRERPYIQVTPAISDNATDECGSGSGDFYHGRHLG